jgi:hypothetical protein
MLAVVDFGGEHDWLETRVHDVVRRRHLAESILPTIERLEIEDQQGHHSPLFQRGHFGEFSLRTPPHPMRYAAPQRALKRVAAARMGYNMAA